MTWATDFYFVKIRASGTCSDKQYGEKLTERLQGEDKDLFLDFCNAYGGFMGDAEVDSFVIGFRLEAKMIFDNFCRDDK